MDFIIIEGTDLRSSRIGLGTWAMGGWMWGGTEEEESVRTIHTALDMGINLIDTAPVYGFGRSEEIVGKAIEQRGGREKILIATKVGLDWHDGVVFRDAKPEAYQPGDRGLSASPQNQLHRSLSGPLARSADTNARNCRCYGTVA